MASESVRALSFEQLQNAVQKASAFRCRVRLEADGGDGYHGWPLDTADGYTKRASADINYTNYGNGPPTARPT